MEEQEEVLKPAEKALLKFWREYVPSYDPRKRQYSSTVHNFPNRTMLYYFMTEDLIAYFDKCDIPGATGQALSVMHVSSGTLADWRKKWYYTWLDLKKI